MIINPAIEEGYRWDGFVKAARALPTKELERRVDAYRTRFDLYEQKGFIGRLLDPFSWKDPFYFEAHIHVLAERGILA